MNIFFQTFPQNSGIMNGTSFWVGRVSYANNPFWSHSLPGITNCPNKKQSISYDLHEAKTYLNFVNEDNFSYEYDLKFCSMLFSDSDLKKWKVAASHEASFLSFYVNKSVVKVPFFKIENNKTLFPIGFEITLSDSDLGTDYPRFTVWAQNFTSFAENLYHFSYHLKVLHQQQRMKRDLPLNHFLHSRKSFLSKHFVIIFYLSVLILIFSIVFGNIFGKKTVNYSGIWRVPSWLAPLTTFSFSGIHILITLLYTYIIQETSNLTIKTGIVQSSFNFDNLPKACIYSMCATSALCFFLMGIIQEKVTQDRYISFSLFTYLFSLFPIRILHFILHLFDIEQGPPIWVAMINDATLLLSFLGMGRGFGRVGNLIKPPFTIDTNFAPSNVPPQKDTISYHLFQFLYVIVAAFVVSQISNEIITSFFLQRELESDLLFKVILIFFIISSINGVLSTFTRLDGQRGSWMDGSMNSNFVISVIIFICCIITSYSYIRSLTAFLYAVVYSFCSAGITFVVGLGSNFLASFLFVYFSFRSVKNI